MEFILDLQGHNGREDQVGLKSQGYKEHIN